MFKYVIPWNPIGKNIPEGICIRELVVTLLDSAGANEESTKLLSVHYAEVPCAVADEKSPATLVNIAQLYSVGKGNLYACEITTRFTEKQNLVRAAVLEVFAQKYVFKHATGGVVVELRKLIDVIPCYKCRQPSQSVGMKLHPTVCLPACVACLRVDDDDVGEWDLSLKLSGDDS